MKSNFFLLLKKNVYYILTYLLLIIILIFNVNFYLKDIPIILITLNQGDYLFKNSNKYVEYYFSPIDNSIFYDGLSNELSLSNKNDYYYEFVYAQGIDYENINGLFGLYSDVKMLKYEEDFYELILYPENLDVVLKVDTIDLINRNNEEFINSIKEYKIGF